MQKNRKISYRHVDSPRAKKIRISYQHVDSPRAKINRKISYWHVDSPRATIYATLLWKKWCVSKLQP